MNKLQIILMSSLILSGCQSLTYQEQQQLAELKYKGITVDHPVGGWEHPAHPAVAGVLNLLPGIGNFYLGSGNGAQSEQNLYGALNFLTWPFSILWGVPEAVIDAKTINQRQMLMYYNYDPRGKTEVQKRR